MDLENAGMGSGDEGTSESRRVRRQYHRHSAEQIQQLEAFFKECPHPDETQRQELSREIGLDIRQIKFWFQNKRTQKKAQNEKVNNSALRAENERIRGENREMSEALRNIVCPACHGPGLQGEERQLDLQMLKMENAQLREQHKKAAELLSNYMEKSPSMHPPRTEHVPYVPRNFFLETDKSVIIETASQAADELIELLLVKDPVWVNSPNDGRFMLHRDSYDKLFPKPLNHYFKSPSARLESSKDSGEVAMSARQLAQILLDPSGWEEMFPTIVTKAKTIEVLDTGGSSGSLHLMYEKMHILSPLVAAREFFFIRCCRQLDASTWVLVDVSYDFFKYLQDAAPTCSWKFPSGCIVQDLSNGKSNITWIEHVQVDDKSLNHRLYRDLVSGGQAYGAKRWIVTLQRSCERFSFSRTGLVTAPKHEVDGVIDSSKGRKNLMALSHRMVKNFCEALSMSDNLDFPHLSELNNCGIRVSVRKSSELGQPSGLIVTTATSLWLPFSNKDLFSFFRDEKKRAQWDVLSSGNPINTIARVSTGVDLGNCISIIQPFVPKENNMLLLQETSMDCLGAIIVYAPIDLPTVTSVINGDQDTVKVQILPSGYVISDDGRAKKGGLKKSGSLLTVAFQVLACCDSIQKQQVNMESVATVHALISSTIQKIKVALDCPDLD
ncbi:Homeobox-leucine zipper protein HDG8 [Striga hermonthica]|uniref:Homeobox-leucine zipper protein HDG8 n=1 Tax=Striga hermonthica TaxID=68872 RepID=A0A9N7MKP4_STRHE|nr:Homeobox-leucine zipper protein HDG8 [Striga hermonthica]